MAKAGFKTITVTDTVYDNFQQTYMKIKDDLKMTEGVYSFSGYMSYLMEKKIKEGKIFQKYKPRFELISIDDNNVVILKDNNIDRIIEVKIIFGVGKLDCLFCQSDSCVHIGFCYSLHQLYK